MCLRSLAVLRYKPSREPLKAVLLIHVYNSGNSSWLIARVYPWPPFSIDLPDPLCGYHLTLIWVLFSWTFWWHCNDGMKIAMFVVKLFPYVFLALCKWPTLERKWPASLFFPNRESVSISSRKLRPLVRGMAHCPPPSFHLCRATGGVFRCFFSCTMPPPHFSAWDVTLLFTLFVS